MKRHFRLNFFSLSFQPIHDVLKSHRSCGSISSENVATNWHIRTERISSSLPTASSSAQITFTCRLVLPMTNPPLVRSSASLALWEFLVRRRQVLPRANQGGVRCPLNKPPMPPSKEARSVPVSAPTGCCLPGIRLTFSLVTIKFSGKRIACGKS